METGSAVSTSSAARKKSFTATPEVLANGDLSFGTFRKIPLVVPAALAPPAGSKLASVITGKGTLVFNCVEAAFAENAPLINLSETGPTIGLHYVGPDAAAPLVWGSSVDGSEVDMAPVAKVDNSGTAPLVLLKAVVTAGSPKSTFGGTTAIVRLPVKGGAPPAGTCKEEDRGLTPFETVYLVFKA
jgi:hypothetical protein